MPGLKKGQWAPEEDALLLRLAHEHMAQNPSKKKINWGIVSQGIGGRTAKQCRERWVNNLDPDIVKGDWTPDEDRKILEMYEQIGARWARIAKELPGRTENSTKIRWKTLNRERPAGSTGTNLLYADSRRQGAPPQQSAAASSASIFARVGVQHSDSPLLQLSAVSPPLGLSQAGPPQFSFALGPTTAGSGSGGGQLEYDMQGFRQASAANRAAGGFDRAASSKITAALQSARPGSGGGLEAGVSGSNSEPFLGYGPGFSPPKPASGSRKSALSGFDGLGMSGPIMGGAATPSMDDLIDAFSFSKSDLQFDSGAPAASNGAAPGTSAGWGTGTSGHLLSRVSGLSAGPQFSGMLMRGQSSGRASSLGRSLSGGAAGASVPGAGLTAAALGLMPQPGGKGSSSRSLQDLQDVSTLFSPSFWFWFLSWRGSLLVLLTFARIHAQAHATHTAAGARRRGERGHHVQPAASWARELGHDDGREFVKIVLTFCPCYTTL